MDAIAVQEARTRWVELIAVAVAGDEVVIEDAHGRRIRLVPESVGGRPRFGSARGLFVGSQDVDAPLQEMPPYER